MYWKMLFSFCRQQFLLCSMCRFKKKLLGVMHWFHGCYVSMSHVEHESAVKNGQEDHCTVGNIAVIWICTLAFSFLMETTQRTRESFSSPPQSDWCSCFLAMGSYDKLGLCIKLQQRVLCWSTSSCYLSSNLSLCYHLACYSVSWGLEDFALPFCGVWTSKPFKASA